MPKLIVEIFKDEFDQVTCMFTMDGTHMGDLTANAEQMRSFIDALRSDKRLNIIIAPTGDVICI